MEARFEDLTLHEKFVAIVRATAQRFYSDRELQHYQGMEGWWITLKGGRRVFVEARYVIRGDVSQAFAGDVIGTFQNFNPKFVSRVSHVSLEPAQWKWWIFSGESSVLGYYQFNTKHISILDNSLYYENVKREEGAKKAEKYVMYNVGGVIAHELAHSHFNKDGFNLYKGRSQKEQKLIKNWLTTSVGTDEEMPGAFWRMGGEKAIASDYAQYNYDYWAGLGHAENFAEWGLARYNYKYGNAKQKKRYKDLQKKYPKSNDAFMKLWNHYGGA